MKIPTLCILYLITILSATGQKLTTRTFYRNIRVGIPAAIQFKLDKRFDSLSLHSSQGVVKRENEYIMLTADSAGADTVFVSFFLNGRRILQDTLRYDVIKTEIFPTFGADLIGDRKISLKKLKAFGGVIYKMRMTDDHWEPTGVKSYRFSILRADSILFSTIESSPRFSDLVKLKIDSLLSGDIIIISDAKMAPLYEKIGNTVPGIFVIE